MVMPKKSNTVIEIVRAFLVAHNFDGLFNSGGDCACDLNDLSPCQEMTESCEAGYKTECDCGDHDWHISRGVELLHEIDRLEGS